MKISSNHKRIANRVGIFSALALLARGVEQLRHLSHCERPGHLSTFRSDIPGARPSWSISANSRLTFTGEKIGPLPRAFPADAKGTAPPIGRFQVIRKDLDHRSSLYGNYVDDSGRVVKANVDSRKDSKPAHSHFVGASMPFFVEFSPGYGLHQGYLPGVAASHGCIRMPYWKARQFYEAALIGTAVVVRP